MTHRPSSLLPSSIKYVAVSLATAAAVLFGVHQAGVFSASVAVRPTVGTAHAPLTVPATSPPTSPTTSLAVSPSPSPDSTTTTTTVPSPPVPYGVPEGVESSPLAPQPGVVDGFNGTGVVVIAEGGAPLHTILGDTAFVTAREGLVFAAKGFSLDRQHVWVYTSCDAYAWVPVDQILAQPPATAVLSDVASFADAVVVVDPGHGGPSNIGAAGGGVFEKDIDLLIAQRVRDLLNGPRSVDWDTGEIFNGEDIPAVAQVWMTRVGDEDLADYEAGLRYRSELANGANAHAMVSIHNNAGVSSRLNESGSDVYYQSQIEESRRFAEILVEEFEVSFSAFDANWVGDSQHGAQSRLSARTGNLQYYGVLRRTEIPTVLAEGAYISNPTEAALLQLPEFQQAYANAVYRAIVRFLTTDDAPAVQTSDPVIWGGVAGNGNAQRDCQIPPQGS